MPVAWQTAGTRHGTENRVLIGSLHSKWSECSSGFAVHPGLFLHSKHRMSAAGKLSKDRLMPAIIREGSQQHSSFPVPTSKWMPVTTQALTHLTELLISLIGTFILNISEQPKSFRHIRKASSVKQRHQTKKIKKKGPRRNTVLLDGTQGWVTWTKMIQSSHRSMSRRKLLIAVCHWEVCGCLLHSKSWLMQYKKQE